jgi:hypothetical protein
MSAGRVVNICTGMKTEQRVRSSSLFPAFMRRTSEREASSANHHVKEPPVQ